jgi:hypothetical protein
VRNRFTHHLPDVIQSYSEKEIAFRKSKLHTFNELKKSWLYVTQDLTIAPMDDQAKETESCSWTTTLNAFHPQQRKAQDKRI